ncbi:MAG: hypothetical protein ACP5FQ_07685 [Thermoplasmata archaeon]
MKQMAKVALGIAMLSGVVLAHPTATRGGNPQERFEHVKARIVNILDRKINFLQKRKACIEKAQNWKEFSSCRPHRKMWHKPIRRERKR